MIIAHRGGAPHLGENSAEAFEYGIASGADMLELDVQRSADGHLVVRHDEFFELANEVRRPVSVLPLNELRRHLPQLLTFDEYLEQFGDRLPANVDLKGEGFEFDIVDAMRRFNVVDQMLISSRSARSLKLVKFLAPEVRIGLSRGQIVPWLGREPHSTVAANVLRTTLPMQLLAHGSVAMADTFMLHYRLIEPWLVRFLHSRDYRVSCWTANDPQTVRWLFDEAGVDFVATDHPERIREFLAS